VCRGVRRGGRLVVYLKQISKRGRRWIPSESRTHKPRFLLLRHGVAWLHLCRSCSSVSSQFGDAEPVAVHWRCPRPPVMSGPFPLPLDFGLWSKVIHDYVGIRKALRAVSRMLNGRAGGRLRGRPRYFYNTQVVQESWMGLVTRRAVGLCFYWRQVTGRIC
jgi:hypothetical protein